MSTRGAQVATQRLVTKAAEQKGWLREHTNVKLHGSSPEHTALRELIGRLGPEKLLARKLSEVERQAAGVDATTLADELGLKQLVIEVGRLPGGVGGRPRHFLKVRDQLTAEICLEWEEPRDQRNTNPAAQNKGEETDALTRKLHGGGDEGGSSTASTPRQR
jgi:hypothetical protein